MRINWRNLAHSPTSLADSCIEIVGYPATILPAVGARRFILTAEPTCCPGCFPSDPSASVEVFATSPIPLGGQALRLTGTWRVNPLGRNQLHDARLLEPPGWRAVSRRNVLASSPLMCLAACAQANTPQALAERQASARRAIEAGPTVDVHSHAGNVASTRRIREGRAFDPIAASMRAGGMAAICLAIAADGPTNRVMEDGHIKSFRAPNPGELYQNAQIAFGRVLEHVRNEGLAVIRDRAGLHAAKAGTASAIIASEGADFLEGRIDRVDEAHAKWVLRHLQLTHYRVNELGDIQTEPPVHAGLTDFGADVIRRCNRLGIVVDVAHGTLALVTRAASVTTKPLVLSHTSLTAAPVPFGRQISAAHAKVIASTGGVIGVWPPIAVFKSLTAMATGMARLVDVVGVDHVGLGSDMAGIPAGSIFPEYGRLPALAEALLEVGFNVADISKLLGGNYARVFTATVT